MTYIPKIKVHNPFPVLSQFLQKYLLDVCRAHPRACADIVERMDMTGRFRHFRQAALEALQ